MIMAEQAVYPKKPYQVGAANAVTMTNRSKDKLLPVRHNTPGNIILVHGVNDIGNSYAAVERGLCEGLATRLSGDLRPANYRLPNSADKELIFDDPEAVFYKRTISDDTLSPVIPFYWGYREVSSKVQTNAKLSRGQALDRFGNRLDKDHSKGGGPFANATTTLPDMWNKGKWGVFRALDIAQKDATHPVLDNPGRMYMILAAQRLAMLICMIRDYDEDEVVSIVAHSQGCLISLLAQAFLLDPKMKAQQPNAKPADTLIMTHPPYSLIADIPKMVSAVDGYNEGDELMIGRYGHIDGIQTAGARLQTLANIVEGVWRKRNENPPIGELSDVKKYYGAVGKGWQCNADRDNRGKVYLYFCPEDMTVALANVQGIGWQGVPEFQRATSKATGKEILLEPRAALGAGFKQRVFTAKKRPDPKSGKPVLVGPAGTPFYFALRQPGEDDQAHTAVSDTLLSKKVIRGHLAGGISSRKGAGDEENRRQGIRQVSGEELKIPVEASLLEGAIADSTGRAGASEAVDPIDASIAITSNYGVNNVWQLIDYEVSNDVVLNKHPINSPYPNLYSGKVVAGRNLVAPLQTMLNGEKPLSACCEVLEVYVCVYQGFTFIPTTPPKILVRRTETPNEARFRWQHQFVPRSFHGAIFGGQANHRNVTAYDVAIGGGKASSDPEFYRYLCAVADWRLQKNRRLRKPSVEWWDNFSEKYAAYVRCEPEWRSYLISANSEYYSHGVLPDRLPVLPEGLPDSVICELI
jgi:hypothetical protein